MYMEGQTYKPVVSPYSLSSIGLRKRYSRRLRRTRRALAPRPRGRIGWGSGGDKGRTSRRGIGCSPISSSEPQSFTENGEARAMLEPLGSRRASSRDGSAVSRGSIAFTCTMQATTSREASYAAVLVMSYPSTGPRNKGPKPVLAPSGQPVVAQVIASRTATA